MSTSTTSAPGAGVLPQHLAALDRANTIKRGRSERHHEIRLMPTIEGRRAVGLLLLESPAWLATARVADVLGWPARMGPTAVRKLLAAERIGERRQVEDLTRRQRVELAARLGVPATPPVAGDPGLALGGGS